jgi:hypothetical protein
MKYLINIVVIILFGWPSLIVSYIWQSILSGFEIGSFLFEQHKTAAIEKFVKKAEGKQHD